MEDYNSSPIEPHGSWVNKTFSTEPRETKPLSTNFIRKTRMPEEIKVTTRRIAMESWPFEVDKIYKVLKPKAEQLRYRWVEKEQENKPDKYGQFIRLTSSCEKKFDEFAKAEMQIEFTFTKMKAKEGKKMVGDLIGKIESKVTFDYDNIWGRTSFRRFLFHFYLKYLTKEANKKKYLSPVMKDTNAMYDAVKEAMEAYK